MILNVIHETKTLVTHTKLKELKRNPHVDIALSYNFNSLFHYRINNTFTFYINKILYTIWVFMTFLNNIIIINGTGINYLHVAYIADVKF